MLTAQADHLRACDRERTAGGHDAQPPGAGIRRLSPQAARRHCLAGRRGRRRRPAAGQVRNDGRRPGPGAADKPSRRSRSKLHICLCLRPVGRATMRQSAGSRARRCKRSRKGVRSRHGSARLATGGDTGHEHHYRQIMPPRALRSQAADQRARAAHRKQRGPFPPTWLVEPGGRNPDHERTPQNLNPPPPPSPAAGTASRSARRARGRRRCAARPLPPAPPASGRHRSRRR